jgi:hypothetical protein
VIFAIDFDGTFCEHMYPEIGEPKYCTINFALDLQKQGHKWILLTMREGYKLEEAVYWLKQYGLKPTRCNDNVPELCQEFNNNPRKVFAHGYIDDRNAGAVEDQIKFFRAEYDI